MNWIIMDPDLIVLIVGCVFLAVFMFVVPVVFYNRQARVARYFRRNKDIRFELVKNVSKNPAALPDDLSQMEMVALLTVITFKDTVSEGLATAQRFTTMGWADRFNGEFFDRLDATARAFASKRWNRESIDLLRLGQMIAQSNNNSHWAREFAESIQGLQYRQVQSGLPTRMK